MAARKIALKKEIQRNTFREAVRQELYAVGEDGKTCLEHMAKGLIDSAVNGNIRALNLLLAVIGEAPSNDLIAHENVTSCRKVWDLDL